ncbi:MAG: hypothetical protein QOF76_2238 [Solirubrobacteraceae bacterium]|jgi:uncharacterized membrane protein YbhN (UPF0104 family)|nr:hypothetical protein [Solirubrobacteraceae bacterium]
MEVTFELPNLSDTLRRLRVPALILAAVVTIAIVVGGPAQHFLDALGRVVSADPRWAIAAAVFEALSFAGYIALLWHVAGSERFGLRESYRTTMAGAAATRLLPTAGAGGAALTLWVLRKAGHSASRTLLTFLVLLYSVFLVAILGAGLAAADHGALALVPAALAGGALLVAAVLTWRPIGRTRTLSLAVRDAGRIVRRPAPHLLGALAWWGFDCAVLWATFHAVGGAGGLDTGVLVLGYFLGQVANTVPLPGAASSGMIGVFIAFGVAPEMALAAVLAYRAIAIWLPAPAGAHALGGLRRTVAGWVPADPHAPMPLAA